LRLCHFDRRVAKQAEVEKSIYGLAIKKQTCPEHTCGEPAESSRGISRLRFAALEMTRMSALIIHNQYEEIL